MENKAEDALTIGEMAEYSEVLSLGDTYLNLVCESADFKTSKSRKVVRDPDVISIKGTKKNPMEKLWEKEYNLHNRISKRIK